MPDDDKPETKAEEARKNNNARWVAAGVATGIGSAAIVAALLYANRSKDKKPGK